MQNYYSDLVRRGGRPAYPFEAYFSSHGYEDYYDIRKYWSFNGGQLGQLVKWKYFQNFQKRNRRNMELFSQYQQAVCKYREDEGIERDIILCFDTTKQTKIDEWKEYHYFQHQKLAHKRALAEEGRQRRMLEKQEWEEALRAGKHDEFTAWKFKDIAETELDNHLFFLTWIERQLPEIAQENAAPNMGHAQNTLDCMDTAETATSAAENVASHNSSAKRDIMRDKNTTKNKELAGPVLGLSGTPKVSKNRKKSKAFSGLRAPVKSVASNMRIDGERQATHTSQHSTSTATPLRRSQRLRDLGIRAKAPEIAPKESEQDASDTRFLRRSPRQSVRKKIKYLG